jgi:hypothetical protein
MVRILELVFEAAGVEPARVPIRLSVATWFLIADQPQMDGMNADERLDGFGGLDRAVVFPGRGWNAVSGSRGGGGMR